MKTNSNPSIDPLDPTVNPVSLRIVESLRKDSNTEPQLITIPTYQSSAPQAEHPGINYEDFAPYFKRNFFNYVPEVTEEQRAQNQPSSEQVLRSAGKFIGKTALNTTGGLAGTVYGGIEALANWDFSKMYNNEVVNKIEELKAKMDEAFPVYKTQEFTESGFFKKLFMHPAQFSDEISDALAFTAGAAVTSIITGGIMNATLPVLAMRTLNTLDKTSKAIQGINQLNKLKVLRGITESSRLTGQLFFGANYESIVETKHSMMELEKNLRIAGVPENEIEEIINQAEKFSWATNMGVVGASNFLQFPKIFRLSYGKELSGLRPSDILFEGNKAVAAYTKASKVGKALRTTATAFEKPFIEGVGEEGIQTVISEVSKDYWSRKNDPEARDTVNLFLDSLVKGFKESYGTKEGWNQIGIGMLIGGMGVPGRGIFPGKYGKDVITDKDGNIISEKRREIWQGGIIGSFQEQSNKRAQIDKIVDELNKNPDVLPVIKSYYEGLIRDISIQKDLDRVLEIKDKFEWKNLKNEQVYNWIRTRVKAGLEDVAKDQISKLKDLTAEEFSIELFGADSEVRVNEEEKNKIIEHLLSKVDEIVEATKLVDRTYQTSYKDKEQDPVREQLIYTISGLKDLDQRESQIYERLSKLTNGIINEKLIRPLHYGTYEQIINALKSSVIDAQGEQKQILEELIKIYENFRQSTKDNKGYDINNLNKEENELMKIWMQKHPTEFTIHNKEVTEMIGDLKKIKERRQAFIDQYNYLFTTDGKTKLKTQEEEIQPEEEIQEEFIEEESFDNKIKNLLEIQKTQPLYITHKGKQLKGKLVVNPDNNSVKFITDKIDNKKITFIINEKNVDLIKPIIKSEEEKEEEIFEALEIVTRAFEKVLNERYKEQKELINELEELDNKLFDERLKLIKAQKDLDFKNFDKRTKAYKETKRLIEVHKETIELYKNYKEKLEQRLKDLQQTTQVIENFIITIQSQKFTKEELNAQYKLLQQIIKFHKNETLEELNNLIELTINHIDQTEQKIKLLEDQLIELELLLEQHKEWAEFIDDFIKNKEEFIRTHYGKRAPLRYDIDVVNNFLDWAEKNQKNPNNPLYKKPSIKVLIETLKELTEAEGLRTEIGEIINKLTKEDSAGSIPFTKYELEILKAQLERQYKELKELNDKLELIKTARIIDATWKGATNYFKQVKADIEELKEELRRKKHEQEKNDAIEPDTLSDKEKYNELQTDLKRSEPLSTSGRGYKTKIENGKPVYVRDENGKLIPKENYSEVNFEKFKDKIDISENDLYVKFVTSDKNPEYFTEGELAAEGIVKYVLSKLTEKKIDADKIIADILANKDLSKQVEL
ncbi:MAG: hypothetical protein KatS3mg002_1400 [Candidatus Woesearchaeota archaeon]|nr:MAG: hypothetical protein KatS3mg002_1400 [Candidatus Woesearchaeota archaeon]